MFVNLIVFDYNKSIEKVLKIPKLLSVAMPTFSRERRGLPC